MEKVKIKIIITGATGMVGEGVLHEALNSIYIEEVLVIGRKPTGYIHPKLKEFQLLDFYKPEGLNDLVREYDACLFCLGVSSIGMKEDEFTLKTHTLTIGFAAVLAKSNPDMTFSYISGSATDSTEKGAVMWARVKGKTENDLAKLGFKNTYAFRPGYLQPTVGMKNTLPYYKYIDWIYPFLKLIIPNHTSRLSELGKAMIECAVFGHQKNIIEVKDILVLSQQMSDRQ
jgi:uncharacterized protein YbjT (DUF2867 family)